MTTLASLRPHYWLFTRQTPSGQGGTWSFTLQPTDGAAPVHATDWESDIAAERLELLTLVRALESLDQPSRVTLFNSSDIIRRGLRFGLVEWAANHWLTEAFDEMVPVTDADLWKRVDRALMFHDLECRILRLDGPHESHSTRRPSTPRGEAAGPSTEIASLEAAQRSLGATIRMPAAAPIVAPPTALSQPRTPGSESSSARVARTGGGVSSAAIEAARAAAFGVAAGDYAVSVERTSSRTSRSKKASSRATSLSGTAATTGISSSSRAASQARPVVAHAATGPVGARRMSTADLARSIAEAQLAAEGLGY